MATDVATARRLTLPWGVHSVQVPVMDSLERMTEAARATALSEGLAIKGDTIIVVSGSPPGISGTTNMLKIMSI
jgi:pyruvate kinase